MNSIIRINEGGDIVKLALVSLAPSLRAPESRFLGACKNNSDLGVFKLNALIFQLFEKRDAHVAAGKIVVRAIDNASFVPHEVQAYPERNKHERDKTERFYIRSIGVCKSYCRDDDKIQRAQAADYCVALKADSAELVVYGPLPRSVGVSVEDNAAFRFTAALFESGDIVSGFFGEQLIHALFVESELDKRKRKPEQNKYDTRDRRKEMQYKRDKHRRDGYVYPAVEGTGVLLEALDRDLFAAAVLFEYLCHVLARLALTLGTGRPLFHVFAYMRNFFKHILCSLVFCGYYRT